MRGGIYAENDPDSDAAMIALLGRWGHLYRIEWVRYLDGWHLDAVPRDALEPVVHIVRSAPGEMDEALEAEEASRSGKY